MCPKAITARTIVAITQAKPILWSLFIFCMETCARSDSEVDSKTTRKSCFLLCALLGQV